MHETFDILDVMEKDSKVVAFVVTDEQPNNVYKARNMEGWSLTCVIRTGPSGNSPTAASNFQIAFRDVNMGYIELFLEKNHLLLKGNYWYSARGIDLDGMEEVLLTGKITVGASEFRQ